MNRLILSLALGTVLLASSGHGQTAAAPAHPTKLFPIATIRGAQAVRDFENNVRVMQAQRQAAIELKAAVDKETNAKKKKELQTKLDAAMKKLNEDNAVMAKTYGFSLARNYTMEIEAANIYLEVTEAEAAQLEAQKAQEAQKAKK